MAILFAILRIILYVLLILLALVFILLLLIFFAPYKYSVRALKEPGQMEFGATVTGLLYMLAVEVNYDPDSGKGLTKDIRVFGISIFDLRRKLNDLRMKRSEKRKEKLRQEKRKRLERMKTEDPERYEQLKAEALARKREARRIEEERLAKEAAIQEEAERLRIEAEERKAEAERLKIEAEERKAEAERLEAEEAEKERRRLEEAAYEEAERKRSEYMAEDAIDQQAEEDGAGQDADTAAGDQAEVSSRKEKLPDKIARLIAENYTKVIAAIWKILSRIIEILFKIIPTIWNLPARLMQKIAGAFRGIAAAFRKIAELRRKAGDILEFILDERTQAALGLLKKQLGRVIRHILPRKLVGYVHFGFEDPYMTGRVLAGVCPFYPKYGKTFRVEPDFEQPVFDGNAELKGRVYLFYLAYLVLAAWLNKNTKFVIQYFKSFNKEDAE